MSETRLTHALDTGAAVLPDQGRIAVFGPRATEDLSCLPRDRVQVIQGFKPDHDAFAAQGYDTAVAARGRYGAAVIFVPRAKALARSLIAKARALTDGPIIVDGAKGDGVDSLWREIRARAEVSEAVTRGHGRLFTVTGGDFSDWEAGAVAGPQGYVTAPGVFSADAVDRGSALLAGMLPARLPGRVADLGAGWGYLARAILARQGVSELHLVEADHAALECARVNVTDPRARFHWADATGFAPEKPVDVVVMNPPFHTGRAAEPSLGRAFIEAAARILTPQGQLFLVANRHLPYETAARDLFAEVAELGGDSSFKIIAASRPRRRSGKPRH